VAVDDKSNEIPAVRKLSELLELSGAVVTLDAMHCQSETATAIRDQGADDVLTVKGNQRGLQKTLLDHVDAWGETNFENIPGLRQHHTKEQNRGRTEQRSYYVAPAPAALKREGRWKDVRSLGVVHRSRTENDRTSSENTYFISRLPPQVKTLAKHIRDHWGVENSLHWTLDVTFTEDDSRIRKGNGPELASIFRRLALWILKHDTSVNDSVRGKRLRAGWDERLLEQMLTSFQAV